MKKINDLMGKPFKHNGETYRLQNYKEVDGVHHLVTDKQWFEFPGEQELKDFLIMCDPVPETDLVPQAEVSDLTPTDRNGLSKPNSGSSDVMAYLKGLLIEDIDRVREDKDYVEQAKTVSNNVKRLIDVAKLEISIQDRNKKQS